MGTVTYRPPPAHPLTCRFVDDALIVVDKPAGLLTVPGRGPEKADCLLSRVRSAYPEAMIVHRLDMATSGLVVMARTPDMQRVLSMRFEARAVEKTYVALVDGEWAAGTTGEIDLPLRTDWPNRPRQIVDPLQGRPSLTRFRVLSSDAGRAVSRVELSPVTGRSHQLRVHLQAVGHPILGDDLYGADPSRRADSRLMLHATRIAFVHPVTGEQVRVSSPAPF